MSKLKTSFLAAIVPLATLAISGCKSTPDVVYLKPDCSVPIVSELPQIDAGELWDAVGQKTYDDLVYREKLIVDWAREMQLMLTTICRGN